MSLPLSQVLSSKHTNMPTSSFRLLLALTTTLTSAVALQTRRALLRSATAASAASAVTLLPALAAHAAQSGVPEGMRTSESYTNLQQLSPETTGTLGAGTISSRSRPSTGVVLLEEVQESGKKDAPSVSRSLCLMVVSWRRRLSIRTLDTLIRGMFYDVEVRSTKGADGAFLQVAKLPSGKSILDVPDAFFTKSVFSTEGRFGAYGQPTDIKVLKSDKGDRRLLDISFSALSPGQTEVPRRALVAAVQPDGADDVVMLVGGSTASQWKKSESAMRNMAKSFRIARTRPTKIPRKAKNDYRFEEQGGLLEASGDSVF